MSKTLLAAVTATALFASVAMAGARDASTLPEFSDTVGTVQVLSSRGLASDGTDVTTLPQFEDTVGNVVVVASKGLHAPAPSIADVGADPVAAPAFN